jgi:hypothetical protein
MGAALKKAQSYTFRASGAEWKTVDVAKEQRAKPDAKVEEGKKDSDGENKAKGSNETAKEPKLRRMLLQRVIYRIKLLKAEAGVVIKIFEGTFLHDQSYVTARKYHSLRI